jgi:hypothetical protein
MLSLQKRPYLTELQYLTLSSVYPMSNWSEFLATDPEVPGSIPVATRFSRQWVWNGVHSAS